MQKCAIVTIKYLEKEKRLHSIHSQTKPTSLCIIESALLGYPASSSQRHFKRTCTHRSSRWQAAAVADGGVRMIVPKCSFKKDTVPNVIGRTAHQVVEARLRYLLLGWGFGGLSNF